MEEAAQSFIGKQGWLFVAGIAAIMFNGLISSSAKGLSLWFSRQYQADDIVILNGRKARIVRVGMSETVFYFGDSSTKLTGGRFNVDFSIHTALNLLDQIIEKETENDLEYKKLMSASPMVKDLEKSVGEGWTLFHLKQLKNLLTDKTL